MYAEIAQRLLEAGGYHCTAVQRCAKVKLKAEHKQKATITQDGTGRLASFYPSLRPYLGHRPASSPSVLQSSINHTGELDDNVTPSSYITC